MSKLQYYIIIRAFPTQSVFFGLINTAWQ